MAPQADDDLYFWREAASETRVTTGRGFRPKATVPTVGGLDFTARRASVACGAQHASRG